MNGFGSPIRQPAWNLGNAPDQLARLEAAGALAPELLHAECMRLRGELRAIATFIPSPLLRQQIAQPNPGHVGGEHWDGSVLFADLSGFTALSERLSALGKQGAEEISTITNRLFGALVDEILHYGGEVLKFGGDALTAFFASSALGEQHAAFAATAALALQARMHEFDALVTPAGTFRLQLRIGVHSGRVFAAQVGDDEHIEFIVTGRVINRVALAQEIAEIGEVIVSGATHKLLRNAQSEPRQADFYSLSALPGLAAPDARGTALPPTGAGDLAEFVALETWGAALRPYLPRSLPGRFLAPAAGASGEFRSVSMLFANFFPFNNALDLLGDDSATAAQVLNSYYRRTQEIVHRYGGIVNKVDMYTFGDKLMALFGAPVAHDNDPAMAVRAALDMRAALDATNGEVAALLASVAPHMAAADTPFFKQRVGINTGVVFAGLVGSAKRREYTVMGQHVNLAARLMSAADQGAVLLSPATRRAVERHVALRPLEPIRLKGIAEPVPVAEALRTFEVAQELQHGRGRTTLVGRDDEVARLLDVGTRALGGTGQVVALVGDAGVGKSRLLEETLQGLVLRSVDPTSGVPAFFPYHVESQSYEQQTPYVLIRQLLRDVLHVDFLAGTPDLVQALHRRIAELAPELARFTPLLADLGVAAMPDTALTAALAPEQRRDRAYELVEAIVLASAREQPLVIILDDLHWTDASSLALVLRLARAIDRAPLLLLLAYRTDPRIDEPWTDLAHSYRLELRELSPECSTALAEALLNDAPPPDLAALLEKTQGNPFFIEEVVRGLTESGTLARTADGWRLTRPVDDTMVPDSIEGVIVARLDRLEDRNREILQVASVVGRRFPYGVLLGLLSKADDLRERLGRLNDADLILIEDLERELAYLFKHALTRDVAYEAILYARRRELHHGVASQIERLYPDRLDEQLGVLARHYLLAEEWSKALDYHIRAGRQAQARYANREAIAFFERALQIVSRLELQPAGFVVIELHERLGAIHALVGEYEAALTRYQEALELLRSQAAAPLDGLVRLHHHIARVHEKRAEFEIGFQWVEQALALDPAVGSVDAVRCLLLGAGLHRRQGRYTQALEWGERALARAEALASTRDQAHALKLLGGTHLGMGSNQRAYELLTRCLWLYNDANDLLGLADAHNDLANTCYELGSLDEARTNYEAGLGIKQAIGDVYGQAMIANNLGGVLKLIGELDQAIAQYQRSLGSFEQLGSLYATGVLHMNLGATYLLNAAIPQAEDHLQRSVMLFHQAGAEDFLPELERYLAKLQLQRGDLERAHLACELALATAIRLEARAEEGITRRVLGQVLMRGGDLVGCWDELMRSLTLVEEADNRYETAQTLMVIAMAATQFDQRVRGQAALDRAIVLLQALGARLDLHEAEALATQHGYLFSP